jgi:hypothetical protein
MRVFPVVAVCIFLGQNQLVAQVPDSVDRTGAIRGAVEVGILGSSISQTPFWLRTNQYGTVPIGGSAATLRAGLARDYKAQPRADTTKTGRPRARPDWGFGLNAVANTGPVDRPNPDFNDARQVLWPDVFGKLRYGAVELFAGRRREVYGLGDTTLTSGFVAWSGNAMTFPKIQIHTPGFVPIGGWFQRAVAFRAGYAHGWFTESLIEDAYLHQKYLYVKFGKPTARLTFTLGLNHQAQWGGRAEYLRALPYAIDGQLPATARDYVSVVLATYPDELTTDQQTDFDGTNRVGNHLGSIDFAFDWTDNRRGWLLYHSHIYEDASGVSFQNLPDGLTGLRWLDRRPTGGGKRVRLVRAVLEVLYTANQSGDIFDQRTRFQGRDNYFNHSQYTNGWSYQGRTIGTPFIAQRATFSAEVNAQIGGGLFPNNRLLMYYAGAELLVYGQIRVTARLAWSRNFGTFNQPYEPAYDQFSAGLTGAGRLPRLPNVWLTGSLGLDRGGLYPDAVGGFLGLQKRW